MGIFKKYDIRGKYPSEINETNAFDIGVGFAISGLLDINGLKSGVIVGRDSRVSSKPLSDAIINGIMSCGYDVIDIGLCTSPMLYFAVNMFGASGGVMVTASHNPAEYNGFKLVRENAIPVASDSGLDTVKSNMGRKHFSHSGSLEFIDVSDAYAAFMSKRFSVNLNSHLVIDVGNGAVGKILTKVLENQGIEYTPLFFEPDGTYPNHDANPLEEKNLRQLRNKMRQISGSIGVAFDGDGDRVCFLDESGDVVGGDIFTAIMAEDILRDNRGKKVLYDLRSSRITPEIINRHGGIPVKTRVGHSFIKKIMREEKAIFGGELSYHYYFADFFNCDSGIYAMLKMCEIISKHQVDWDSMHKTSTPLISMASELRKYYQSGEINFEVNDTDEIIEYVKKYYANCEVSMLDGLSVESTKWWFNLRPSNTESLLRLNVEAVSNEELSKRVRLVRELIGRINDQGGKNE